MKILWLDTETTGLNKEKCDITQIAGIIVIDGEEKERFNFHCQPVNWECIEPVALEKTNMTVEKLKEFPLPQETYKNLITILDKYIDKYSQEDKFYLAGHNVQFDMEFLRTMFNKMGDRYFGSYFWYKTIDLMALCTILHTACLINLTSWKLDEIAKYLEVPVDENLHDAAVDIDITRKCFCKLAKKYIKFEE